MVVNEGKLGDTLAKVGKGLAKGALQAQGVKNYLLGKSNTKYNFSQQGEDSDYKYTELGNSIYKGIEKLIRNIRLDVVNGMAEIKLSVTNVPTNLADYLNPSKKDEENSIYKYVVDYNNGTITLEIPFDFNKAQEENPQRKELSPEEIEKVEKDSKFNQYSPVGDNYQEESLEEDLIPDDNMDTFRNYEVPATDEDGYIDDVNGNHIFKMVYDKDPRGVIYRVNSDGEYIDEDGNVTRINTTNWAYSRDNNGVFRDKNGKPLDDNSGIVNWTTEERSETEPYGYVNFKKADDEIFNDDSNKTTKQFNKTYFLGELNIGGTTISAFRSVIPGSKDHRKWNHKGVAPHSNAMHQKDGVYTASDKFNTSPKEGEEFPTTEFWAIYIGDKNELVRKSGKFTGEYYADMMEPWDSDRKSEPDFDSATGYSIDNPNEKIRRIPKVGQQNYVSPWKVFDSKEKFDKVWSYLKSLSTESNKLTDKEQELADEFEKETGIADTSFSNTDNLNNTNTQTFIINDMEKAKEVNSKLPNNSEIKEGEDGKAYLTVWGADPKTLETTLKDYDLTPIFKEESVMTPTPTPYEGDQVDKYTGKKIVKEEIDDTESKIASLEKTIEQLQSSLEKVLNELNKEHKQVSESIDSENKLEGELRDKIKTYLNSIGWDDSEITGNTDVEIEDTEDGLRVNVGAELDYEELSSLAEALDEVIIKYDKDSYFDVEDAGRLVALISDDSKKEAVSFKDSHKCSICGKSLSECECNLEEEFSSSGATQPSSIGQHKSCSIDMIGDKEDSKKKDLGLEEGAWYLPKYKQAFRTKDDVNDFLKAVDPIEHHYIYWSSSNKTIITGPKENAFDDYDKHHYHVDYINNVEVTNSDYSAFLPRDNSKKSNNYKSKKKQKKQKYDTFVVDNNKDKEEAEEVDVRETEV